MVARAWLLVACMRVVADAETADSPDHDSPDHNSKVIETQTEEEPVLPPCDDRDWYGEPSLSGGVAKRLRGDIGDAYLVIHRITIGVLARQCTATHEDARNVRVGATIVATTGPLIGLGLGLEAEVNYPVRPPLRLGGRLGGETNGDMTMITLGMRARAGGVVVFGVDAFYLRHEAKLSGERAVGGTVTLAFEGNFGKAVTIGEFIVLGIGAMFVLHALADD